MKCVFPIIYLCVHPLFCSHKHAICRKNCVYGRAWSARTSWHSSDCIQDRRTGMVSSCDDSYSRAECSPTAERTPSHIYDRIYLSDLLLAHIRLVACVNVLLVQVQSVLCSEHLVTPTELAVKLPLVRRMRLPVLVQPGSRDEASIAARLLALVQLPILRVLHLVSAQRQLRREPLATAV